MNFIIIMLLLSLSSIIILPIVKLTYLEQKMHGYLKHYVSAQQLYLNKTFEVPFEDLDMNRFESTQCVEDVIDTLSNSKRCWISLLDQNNELGLKRRYQLVHIGQQSLKHHDSFEAYWLPRINSKIRSIPVDSLQWHILPHPKGEDWLYLVVLDKSKSITVFSMYQDKIIDTCIYQWVTKAHSFFVISGYLLLFTKDSWELSTLDGHILERDIIPNRFFQDGQDYCLVWDKSGLRIECPYKRISPNIKHDVARPIFYVDDFSTL